MLLLFLENALGMTPEPIFKQQEQTSLLDPGEASSSFGMWLTGKGWLGGGAGRGYERGRSTTGLQGGSVDRLVGSKALV